MFCPLYELLIVESVYGILTNDDLLNLLSVLLLAAFVSIDQNSVELVVN